MNLQHLQKIYAKVVSEEQMSNELIRANFIKKIMINQDMVTTNIELPGYKIVKNLGVVRGITVRSRSIFGNIAGGLQTLVGGKISIYRELCEKTREEAFQQMIDHAGEMGADAIINVRYDANEVIGGVTEVLAYGAAVKVERA